MESTKREEEREGGKGLNTSQNREVNIDQYLLKRTVDSKSKKAGGGKTREKQQETDKKKRARNKDRKQHWKNCEKECQQWKIQQRNADAVQIEDEGKEREGEGRKGKARHGKERASMESEARAPKERKGKDRRISSIYLHQRNSTRNKKRKQNERKGKKECQELKIRPRIAGRNSNRR